MTVIEGVPSIYQEQDADIGQGMLKALLEGLVPSLDGMRQKIRDYDHLRNPLLCPVEQDFLVAETILKTENLGDGTSRVFLSEGPDGDKFTGLRPGMTLSDFRGVIFVICKVARSSLALDFTDPPIDPATGVATGRHIIVANIGQVSTEFVPFTSGTQFSQENPTVTSSTGTIVTVAPGSIIDGEIFTIDDGINTALIFEFDTVPDGVSGANVVVDISAAVSDVTVADAMVLAINAAAPLNLVASNGGGTLATVTIANTGTGVEGDVAWTDGVADAGFVVTSPTGGGPGAFIFSTVTQSDDGVRLAPYAFNAEGSYVDALDIALNRVTIEWTEGSVFRSGWFTSEGKPGGDLVDTSVIDFTVGAVGTGQITMYNDSGVAIDANSILVTYTRDDSPPPEDAEIRAQSILAFLSNDVGIRLDRNDPEVLQRSYTNNASKIWDIKGTELGYDILGQYAGYFVSAKPLYSITEAVSVGLPSNQVFEFPAGEVAVGSIVAVAFASLIDGETFNLDDGVNPFIVFEFDTVPDGVSGSNVVVDISAAVSSVDVADAMVSAINATGSLELVAGNGSGTTSLVTITNQSTGELGNVTNWSDTVADSGFIITQPTGGVNGSLFTTVDPKRPKFDELILDALPLDLFCFDASYPTEVQSVIVTAVESVRSEGSNKRVKVTVTTAEMYSSFGRDGSLTDVDSVVFEMENFARIDATSYSFETSDFVIPVVGVGSVTWKVFKFEAPNTITIFGIGTDVIDLGRQSVGHTGRRYRITKTFTDPPLADTGNWLFIDFDGVVSYIESFIESPTTPGDYEFEIVSATAPAAGTANVFLECEIVTDCTFCRASSLLVRISPSTILNFPEALAGDALGRLILRLQQMIPGHVRIAAFVFDPGPAVATWGFIAATTVLGGGAVTEDALFSAYYDEDEFPADEIPVDSAPIVATSQVTITNENVLEEFLDGADPLIAGTWTAAGLWHITEYRSSTQYASFNYGQNDVGRLGEGGAVAPDYDGVPIATVSRLISPIFSLLAADSAVVVRFRHFGDVKSGVVNDLVRVEIFKGAGLFHTITKATLGLSATGTNGGFTTYSQDIESLVVADDSYHLEFVFDTAGAASGAGTGEGWYIDDVEVQVTP